MRKIKLNCVALLFLTFMIGKVQAQVYDSVLNIYDEQFPKEKIHIHFDRTIYNTGETIFYKLYVLSGMEFTSLSKNVYVVWYDTSGNYIKQTVAPLFQSSAKGSYEVPLNYKGDFLHIKAFTRWMLNDDSVFLYEKNIPINTGSLAKSKINTTPKTRVEVFPEGGVLVNGLNSKIAFKATNGSGMPVFVKGFLLNDKNKILDTLKVAHDGMGTFQLKPTDGESYQLSWTDENAQKGITPIVAAKNEGVILKLSMDNEKAYAQVERTLDVPQNYKQMKLLVHQNQHLIYTVDFKGEERQVQRAGLPIDEMPTGILQFSLFTKDWLPLAERIVFVNNRLHEFNAKVTEPLTNLSKRGKNVIEVMVSDTSASNMSVSITDASIVMPEQQTIYSDFLLSNDIRGKVFNPAYYFSSDADSVAAHLDLVMLTNGWRKFDWDKIKAGIVPVLKFPRETDFMKITGKVFGSSATKLSSDLMLNLIISGKDSSKKFVFMPVLKDGTFEDKTIFYYDTSRIFYGFNGNNKLTDITQVHFENGLFKQDFRKINLGSLGNQNNWSDSMARAKLNFYLLEQEKLRKQMASATLQEVIVKSRSKSPLQILDEKYATGMFSGFDGSSFDLTNDPSAAGGINILAYLQGKVAGLQISVSGAQASATWRGSNTDFFLNEITTPLDMILSLPISDIAYVKAIRPPFFGSIGGGSGGAIAIYTKKGKNSKGGSENSKGMENAVLGGYSVFKEFYNPNYENPTGNFDADNRTTIYWNPFVLTNKRSPRVKIEFYNNDSSKKLQIVLEGINSNGKLARVVHYIE
ncbi:MAG: hypothetical protein WCJ80_11650 [Bacteroidota bacterium]